MKLIFTLFIVTLMAASAATSEWDGGGADAMWSNPTNWVGDVAPPAGDDLVFPSVASQKSNVNDFPAGTTFNSITILGAGYTLSGSNVALNAGIKVATVVINNTIFLPLTLNSNQSFTVSNSTFNPLIFRGTINLGSNTLTFAGPGFFSVLSQIIGSGGIKKTGVGGAQVYATNTFEGPLEIFEGTFSIYRSQVLGPTNGGTYVGTNGYLTLGSSPGTLLPVEEALILEGTLGPVSANYQWVGPITLGTSNAVVSVIGNATLTVDGLVSGGGGMVKNSSGNLILNANNTYSNRTQINDGVLRVNGNQPQSDIFLYGGMLGGTGVVGAVTAVGIYANSVSPGGSPGILSCSNLTLNSVSTLMMELNGTTPGTEYDQLNVNGSVTLGNAGLAITSNVSLPGGQEFMIINNDGGDAVNGTLFGLPEGASVSAGQNHFTISYVGGDGNDVVLTSVVPRPLLLIEPAPPDSIQVLWPTNASGFVLQWSTNLATTNWSTVATTPVVVGTNNSVSEVTAETLKFYRLFKP